MRIMVEKNKKLNLERKRKEEKRKEEKKKRRKVELRIEMRVFALSCKYKYINNYGIIMQALMS